MLCPQCMQVGPASQICRSCGGDMMDLSSPSSRPSGIHQRLITTAGELDEVEAHPQEGAVVVTFRTPSGQERFLIRASEAVELQEALKVVCQEAF